MTTNNGTAPTIEDAERAALQQQETIPAPYVPPAPPADPAVYAPNWWDNLIVANEANLRQQQGNVSQLRKQLADAEQAEQRIVGALEALRALKLMGGNAQA